MASSELLRVFSALEQAAGRSKDVADADALEAIRAEDRDG
jgi:hypothetical protein